MPAFEVTEGDVGLKVVNLRKSYRKRLVIRDVSMELGRGEVVALLGPNGSGKTTCFYSIAGLVTPEGVPSMCCWTSRLQVLIPSL